MPAINKLWPQILASCLAGGDDKVVHSVLCILGYRPFACRLPEAVHKIATAVVAGQSQAERSKEIRAV